MDQFQIAVAYMSELESRRTDRDDTLCRQGIFAEEPADGTAPALRLSAVRALWLRIADRFAARTFYGNRLPRDCGSQPANAHVCASSGLGRATWVAQTASPAE